ncbi:uncharacterized protein V1518DRAFT_423079 [Limtongia smithiae]|uniref:uncharacterized protein n=1 Tax=Limtongia smithiae TaxID=1125753 RepID=UPI0034CEDFB0
MGLALAISAELTGVTDLHPVDSADTPYTYSFTVQCTSCREIHPNAVEVTAWESHELSGSRGEANFVWRCRACRRESSASFKMVAKQPTPPTMYTAEDSGKWKNVVEFDVRGLEFTDFQVTGEWTCKSTENTTVFSEVDLEPGEWFDYDEKAGQEVMITDVKWQIRNC